MLCVQFYLVLFMIKDLFKFLFYISPDVISFIFVLEITTSLIQLLSKKFLKRKVFPAAPIHLSLQKYGWEEPKIVQRAWLLQIMLTIFGVWLAVL